MKVLSKAVLLASLFVACLWSCRKSEIEDTPTEVAKIKSWYNSVPHAALPIEWENAKVITDAAPGYPVYTIPITWQVEIDKGGMVFRRDLLIYKTSDSYRVEIRDLKRSEPAIINGQQRRFTGIVAFYDPKMKPILVGYYKNGRWAASAAQISVASKDEYLSGAQTEGCDWVINGYFTTENGVRTFNYDKVWTCTSPGGGSGDNSDPQAPIDHKENVDGPEWGGGFPDDPIVGDFAEVCSKSFVFNKVIAVDELTKRGGWQIAAISNVHMNLVETKTGAFRMVIPGKILYFGLPVIKNDGTFFNVDYAAAIAVRAERDASRDVLNEYKKMGGTVDPIGMGALFLERMNYHMGKYGGSVSLLPGLGLEPQVVVSRAEYGVPGC